MDTPNANTDPARNTTGDPANTPSTDETMRQKLVEEFKSLVQVRKPDFAEALRVPVADLQAGNDQVTSLIEGVARTNSEEVNTDAVGRQRFPEVHSVASRVGEGLAKNPDIAAEILATPNDFNAAIGLDQSIGRFIYVSQLLARGGDTGNVLAGASLQKMCTDLLAEARRRIADKTLPAQVRSDISVFFEEPFRLEQDEQQRQQAAASAANRSGQGYVNDRTQKEADSLLLDAINTYLTGVQSSGGQLP